jgi:hypothetical protein
MSPIRFSPSSLKEGRWYEYPIRFALGGAATAFTGLQQPLWSIHRWPLSRPSGHLLRHRHSDREARNPPQREAGLAGERRGKMAAAVDSAGAALGATGMLAFAIVFSLTAETKIAAAFMGASFTWLIVSVAAWYVRRKARSPDEAKLSPRRNRLSRREFYAKPPARARLEGSASGV